MAKVNSPFLSTAASGSVGKSLTASRWRSIKIIRQYAVPTGTPSAAQILQRSYLRNAINFWKAAIMSTDCEEAWGRYTSKIGKRLTAMNAFAGAMKNFYHAGKEVVCAVDFNATFPTSSQIKATWTMCGVTAQTQITISAREFRSIWGRSVRNVGLLSYPCSITLDGSNLDTIYSNFTYYPGFQSGDRWFVQLVEVGIDQSLPLSGIFVVDVP